MGGGGGPCTVGAGGKLNPAETAGTAEGTGKGDEEGTSGNRSAAAGKEKEQVTHTFSLSPDTHSISAEWRGSPAKKGTRVPGERLAVPGRESLPTAGAFSGALQQVLQAANS